MTTDMIVEEAVQVTDENLSKKTGDEPEVVETEKKDEKPEEKNRKRKNRNQKKIIKSGAGIKFSARGTG
jgi:hypothetical protein